MMLYILSAVNGTFAATRLECTTSHLGHHAAAQQKATENADILTFVTQPQSGAIHMFLMQYTTDETLRALPLLMPPPAGATARKQTPCSSILDEKNYIARKILLALWYLYVIFSSELREVSAARRLGFVKSGALAVAHGRADVGSRMHHPREFRDREDFR
ncbi:hypothetical protein HF263_08925 [Rhizobium leguminosarum]|nr:hypothetical protein [Rhizobium leguminosarum]MBY2991947.1 hypothetical protein [Rhizobium leguminosarum]MBY3056182.1 hypothetical protein [Rhizobium leguminosarum]